MATTRTNYLGDGSTRAFNITFPYVSTSDVTVTVDGATVPFIFQTPALVQLGTAPAAGTSVVVKRRTSVELPRVVFADNAVLTDNDLNKAVGQTLSRLQEIDDEAGEGLTRALKAPLGETLGTLPGLNDRRGRFLAFAADGSAIAATSSGGADSGLRTDLAFNGDALVAAQAAAEGAIARAQKSKNDDNFSIRDFGAKGDGIANDTDAVNKAMAAAKLAGKAIYVPAAPVAYMIDPIAAQVSIYGEGPKSKFKYRGNISPGSLITAAGIDDFVAMDFLIDGSVSADPAAWSSSNYDAFTGASGLSVQSSKRPRIIGVMARNTRQHGFRTVDTVDALFAHSSAIRARGAFGDGFFMVSSVNTTVFSSVAADVTRIGFVQDTFGGTLAEKKTAYRVSVMGSYAYNAHHQSADYGGKEFNAGYWFENVGDVTMSGSYASDTRIGINLCSGVRSNGITSKTCNLNVIGCHVSGGEWGILTYSLDTFPVNSNVMACSVSGAIRAFGAVARNPTDSFEWTSNSASYVMGGTQAGNARGYSLEVGAVMSGKPRFVINGGVVNRENEQLADLNNTTTDLMAADVGSSAFTQGAADITVRGLRNGDSSKPIYVRLPGSFAHDVHLQDVDFHWKLGASYGGRIVVSGNSIVRSMTASAGVAQSVHINGETRIVGQMTIAASQGTIDAIGELEGNANIFLLSPSSGGFPAWTVRGSYAKDMSQGSILRLGFGSGSWTGIVQSAVFYNRGPAQAATPAIQYSSGTRRVFSGVVLDSSVTNVTGLDEGGGMEDTVPGVTKANLH